MKRALPWLTLLAALGLWFAAVRWSGTRVFPSPAEVARGLGELAQKHVLWADIADSLRRVCLGFGAAVSLGVPLGFVLGWYPRAHGAVNPTIELLRPISPIAWIPVVILLVGVGDRAATVLIFLGAFFPVLFAAVEGVRSVPTVYRQASRNFGLSTPALLGRVVLPAALPRILVGLRIAFGVAWLVVVAAEMVAVDSGLGYLVLDSRNSGKRYDLVVAAMLVIGLLGLALDTAVRSLERAKFVRWGFQHGA